MADRGQKRKKTGRGSASQSYNTDLFRSLGCKQFYDSIAPNSKFVRERAIFLAQGEFEDMQANIRNRGWERFVSYPKRASKALTFEFFTNILPKTGIDGSLEFPSFTSYVRGHTIPFDSNTINELFGITPVPVSNCMFQARLSRNPKVDTECAAEILAALCRPGIDWERNESDAPQKIYTKFLTPVARGWAAFILSTIAPCSNQSELNINRATLATAIILGEPINLGCVLADEIHDYAKFDGKKVGWWRHASLVTLLCEKAGVVAEADEETITPGSAITGGWIRTNSIPLQRQQPPVPREEPQEEQPDEQGPTFDYDDFPVGPSVADFQRLEARMDVLAANQERMAEEHRFGMRAIYRALCTFQSGGQLDPGPISFKHLLSRCRS